MGGEQTAWWPLIQGPLGFCRGDSMGRSPRVPPDPVSRGPSGEQIPDCPLRPPQGSRGPLGRWRQLAAARLCYPCTHSEPGDAAWPQE